jgi:hypothetical protein
MGGHWFPSGKTRKAKRPALPGANTRYEVKA